MESSITHNLKEVRASIPSSVTLVCVSKYHPVEAIREAYETGERHFGESRVQELKAKIPALPADIRWHFIGHLQTNKVRDLLKLRPYLIHSVDSLHLLQVINDEAARQGFVQDVLLEVHVAREETKSGFSPEELYDAQISNLKSQISTLPNVRIQGLMTMATNTDDENEIRRCFTTVKQLHDQWATGPVLSMGMSDDYRIAIACGATMVRIGSTIFGEREYHAQRRLPKAVFFDQDGILFDSMPNHARAWERAMQENGIPYTAMDCYRNEGRTGSGVIQEIYERLHGTDAPEELIQKIYDTKSHYFIELSGGKLPSLIPGVREVLQYLHSHGVQCWVVTGSGQRNLINSLNDTFDGVFSGIISAFDVTHGKPDPEPYLKAWERSGFKKEECFVVENAPLGVRAGKGAGLAVMAVNTGILPDEALAAEGADHVFPNMAALLAWLQQ